jgi:hypothetical protein
MTRTEAETARAATVISTRARHGPVVVLLADGSPHCCVAQRGHDAASSERVALARKPVRLHWMADAPTVLRMLPPYLVAWAPAPPITPEPPRARPRQASELSFQELESAHQMRQSGMSCMDIESEPSINLVRNKGKTADRALKTYARMTSGPRWRGPKAFFAPSHGWIKRITAFAEDYHCRGESFRVLEDRYKIGNANGGNAKRLGEMLTSKAAAGWMVGWLPTEFAERAANIIVGHAERGYRAIVEAGLRNATFDRVVERYDDLVRACAVKHISVLMEERATDPGALATRWTREQLAHWREQWQEHERQEHENRSCFIGGVGREASEVTDLDEVKAIWSAYRGNGGALSYEQIEKDAKFNLRAANGTTAFRICKRHEAGEVITPTP